MLNAVSSGCCDAGGHGPPAMPHPGMAPYPGSIPPMGMPPAHIPPSGQHYDPWHQQAPPPVQGLPPPPHYEAMLPPAYEVQHPSGKRATGHRLSVILRSIQRSSACLLLTGCLVCLAILPVGAHSVLCIGSDKE